MATTYLTAAASNTWIKWCTSNTVTCTSISSTAIWVDWCDSTSSTSITTLGRRRRLSWTSNTDDEVVAYAPTRPPCPPISEEERARHERDMQAARERMAAEQQRIREADERAQQCLLDNLNEEQRKTWLDKGHFIVHGRSGRRYRVRRFAPGNIDEINRKGFISTRLCVHSYGIPNADNILAQKLHLESNEEEVMRIANRHPVTDRSQVLPALQ